MDTPTPTKVILLSQSPLPFSKIGSWTTLYKNYLESTHQIDWIVCEAPSYYFEGVQYQIVKNDFVTKLKGRLFKNPRYKFLNALAAIVQPNEKYIIQLVDNYGMVKPLLDFLNQQGLRKNVYIQFFHHGHSAFYEDFKSRFFFESIDEMVLLTHASYQLHKNYYTILPTRFSVLHNGIDTRKFHAVSDARKNELKAQKGVAGKQVFIWCSQDRPKKGLSLILDAWKRVYAQRKECVLWVVGADRVEKTEGVTFFGKVPNDALPEYFQTSDCYLFPTLCQEGFGMSLIEALHCGNYCIASAMGGVPEVLQYGKLGKLIEAPHFVQEWEKAMLLYLEQPKPTIELPSHLYTTESWNEGMNALISSAKLSM